MEQELNISIKLLKNRIIFITGEINDNLANNIIIQLLYLNSLNNKEEIKLYINSPGGSVTAGLAIYDTINIIKSPVSTLCFGIAASMAAFILSSGKKGKRYALKNSTIMIHQPAGYYKGKASDIKIQTKELLKIKKKLNKILSLNTKQKYKKIKKDTNNDKYLTSKESISYGIIDKIVNEKK